ncbi:MAG: KpsF/GutQ family sugar-phosphate isomerase [Acidobacteria bacterium]|nr:KpsF/GutQ family sugar-phosphate isomerase [Acidobacteriota bacterium]
MSSASQEKANSVHARVVELLRLEASAIEHSAVRLDPDSVAAAVSAIRNCAGKIVVTGTGKSGVIAQKIAQTLTSTGTVAIYLHPSDALHGGLGVVAAGDVVIALSNSGETDEILAMMPSLKAREVQVVAIVGNLASSLARQAAIVLEASVDREACPLNLAPTTSTTVALAIGDALAMTLMESRGVTEADFAVNHPAGRLGKRLTLRVGDLMQESPSVDLGTSWLEVVRTISKYSLGAVTVVNDDRHLVGIVTDGDLRRTIERSADDGLAGLTAEQMMTTGPVTTTKATLAFDAMRLMEDRPSQISVLPVIDEAGQCLGLIRLHDIVRSGL